MMDLASVYIANPVERINIPMLTREEAIPDGDLWKKPPMISKNIPDIESLKTAAVYARGHQSLTAGLNSRFLRNA